MNVPPSDARPSCAVRVEFDVTESVTLSSGTYVVKLAKRSGVTGIKVRVVTSVTSQGSEREERESLVVTDVVKGSVAHRSGSLQVYMVFILI